MTLDQATKPEESGACQRIGAQAARHWRLIRFKGINPSSISVAGNDSKLLADQAKSIRGAFSPRNHNAHEESSLTQSLKTESAQESRQAKSQRGRNRTYSAKRITIPATIPERSVSIFTFGIWNYRSAPMPAQREHSQLYLRPSQKLEFGGVMVTTLIRSRCDRGRTRATVARGSSLGLLARGASRYPRLTYDKLAANAIVERSTTYLTIVRLYGSVKDPLQFWALCPSHPTFIINASSPINSRTDALIEGREKDPVGGSLVVLAVVAMPLCYR
nr:hypothetical protein Iba_chr11aCG14710 [Ipomoea batatas]